MEKARAIIADMGGSGEEIMRMAELLPRCPIQIVGGLASIPPFELDRNEFEGANTLIDMSMCPNLDLLKEAIQRGLVVVVASRGIAGKENEKILLDFADDALVVVAVPGCDCPQQMIDAADAVFRYEKMPGIHHYTHWR